MSLTLPHHQARSVLEHREAYGVYVWDGNRLGTPVGEHGVYDSSGHALASPRYVRDATPDECADFWTLFEEEANV